MRRNEAEKLLGTPVEAWTAANGRYVGILEEITSDRPWRGRVRITGILEPAVTFEIGRHHPRRGFRVDETIEVGATSIRASLATGTDDYRALLERQAENFERTHASYLAGELGNPEDPSLRRLYAWQAGAAKMVREAIRIHADSF